MIPQPKATSTSAPGCTPCVRVCMCVGVCLCMTTKKTGNFCDCLCFGGGVTLIVFRGLRWSHLGYISRHIAVTMDLCGFTQPSVLCILGHRWRLLNFGKSNLVGVVSGIVSGQTYGHIYIQIYTPDVWCFPVRFLCRYCTHSLTHTNGGRCCW